MSKMTKQQIKRHEEVEALLWGSSEKLTPEQVAFCLEHWDPRALSGKYVAKNQAYFTPLPLALDAGRYIGGDGRRVVDIGAGIGRLTYAVLCANWWDASQVQMTAVEINEAYLKVGQRIMPEVTWVQGDFYDLHLWQNLPRFDQAISNPPFGQVLTDYDTSWIGYRGPAGLMVAAIGLQIARLGITMILPQMQTPFCYSGAPPGKSAYAASQAGYLKRFIARHPELEWHHSSIDTAQEVYTSGWRGVSPVVELVSLQGRNGALLPLRPTATAPKPNCSLALTGHMV